MHDHAHSGDPRVRNRRRLTIALALAAGYMVAEIVGGLLTGSLALLADAGHMFSDAAALTLALFASWVASRPSGLRWTYGLARAEILAALAQGAGLVAVAVLVLLEAIERLQAPHAVQGLGMLAVASGGLLVNLLGLWVLGSGRHDNLNMRGAWLHVLSDALGSVGAMAAGFAVWRFGWVWADPAASLAISLLILVSAWSLLRDAVDVLMEAAPRDVDLERIQQELMALQAVSDVHDLHVWTIGSGETALSCHLVVSADAGGSGGRDRERLLGEACDLLADRFGIGHATVQIEPAGFTGARAGA
ncbi:MAG: cation transporter, partial [Myxococcales bacterium]|nr:cation transporter [Myxococcales bacterium]